MRKEAKATIIYWYTEAVYGKQMRKLLSENKAILRHLKVYQDSSFIDSPVGKWIVKYAERKFEKNSDRIQCFKAKSDKCIAMMKKLRDETT